MSADRPIERILPHLIGATRAAPNGNVRRAWMARCPAHADAHASLSIGETADGKVLLRCHAGCNNATIVAALGIELRDLFVRRNGSTRRATRTRAPAPKAATTAKPAGGRTWATPQAFADWWARTEGGTPGGIWSYADAGGAPVLAVVRVNLPDDAKSFRPLHATAVGWVKGDPPGPLPLYRLCDVRAAAAADARVFIVEGEKTADALAALGFVTTTSAHGAKSAAKTDWTPLAAADVRLLPDYDSAGESYARDVAGLLRRLDPPATVRIVQLPGLPDHGDAVDFIAARRTAGLDDRAIAAEIDRLAESAPAWTEPVAPHGGNGDADADAPIIVNLADVQAEPVRWLWPGRIALGKLSLIVGDPSFGKSTITLDLAARVSTGAGWPDAPTERFDSGGVVLLSAEDDLSDTIRPRLDAAGANVSRIVALTAIRTRDAQTGEARERGFDLVADLHALERAVTGCDGCKMVVVDPISAYLGATDSHKNSDVRGVLAPLSALAARCGVAVVAVTHLRKGEGPALYRAMGSLAFIAAARAAWCVTKDANDPNGARRLFLCVKNNLAADLGGLAYEIRTTEGGQPIVAWSAERVTVTADAALAPPPSKPGPAAEGRDAAVAWLREALAGGPRPAAELCEEAREAEGISAATLRRARKSAGVTAYRPTNPGAWWWKLEMMPDVPASEPDSVDSLDF